MNPELSAHDFDLLEHMTDDQRRKLADLAKDAGMKPAEFVADFLVRHNILSEEKPSAPSVTKH